MPNYEVTVSASIVVLDCASEAEAKRHAEAMHQTPYAASVREIPDAELESAKQIADAVSEP